MAAGGVRPWTRTRSNSSQPSPMGSPRSFLLFQACWFSAGALTRSWNVRAPLSHFMLADQATLDAYGGSVSYLAALRSVTSRRRRTAGPIPIMSYPAGQATSTRSDARPSLRCGPSRVTWPAPRRTGLLRIGPAHRADEPSGNHSGHNQHAVGSILRAREMPRESGAHARTTTLGGQREHEPPSTWIGIGRLDRTSVPSFRRIRMRKMIVRPQLRQVCNPSPPLRLVLPSGPRRY